jgi:hypothetical protein
VLGDTVTATAAILVPEGTNGQPVTVEASVMRPSESKAVLLIQPPIVSRPDSQSHGYVLVPIETARIGAGSFILTLTAPVAGTSQPVVVATRFSVVAGQ